jgi:hypothetical protein
MAQIGPSHFSPEPIRRQSCGCRRCWVNMIGIVDRAFSGYRRRGGIGEQRPKPIGKLHWCTGILWLVGEAVDENTERLPGRSRGARPAQCSFNGSLGSGGHGNGCAIVWRVATTAEEPPRQ